MYTEDYLAAFIFQTAPQLVYHVQIACVTAQADQKTSLADLPANLGILPPTSAATLLRLSATGVDGADFPCPNAEANDVAMLVNASLVASDVA